LLPEGTSFVYSDGDDGTSQHALISTSHLVFGNLGIPAEPLGFRLSA
jgi:hypothetical protein